MAEVLALLVTFIIVPPISIAATWLILALADWLWDLVVG